METEQKNYKVKLHHKILGSGEPLFILHGLFGMLDNWMTLAKELANDYQVILVDLRNHGKSPHDTDVSYRAMADDLSELMADLDMSEGHVLGHSMGGKSAMTFAERYSAKCKSMIVVDIAPKTYAASHTEIFDAILNIDLSLYIRRTEIDQTLAKTINILAVRQFLLKNLKRTSDGFGWKANFEALYDGYVELLAIEQLGKSEVPILFVRATESNYISRADRRVIENIYEYVKIVDIVSGHWVHAEKPKELLRVIRSHLTTS